MKTKSLKELLLSLIKVEEANCTPSSGWAHYANNMQLKVCRVGPMVWLTGAVRNTTAITCDAYGSNVFNVATIPQGYRPTQAVIVLSQGSGSAVWCGRIYPDGSVRVERYRDVVGAKTPTSLTTGIWFPFSATWIMGG